jgi:SAM-dependent methyltransferase
VSGVYDRVTRESVTARSASGDDGLPAADLWRWPALRKALLGQACEPYRRAGRFAYHFARGKLRHDPVFRAILELGLLRERAHILDLGCGQGVLAAWLRAAERCYSRGLWPRLWPPPPCPRSIRGIELRRREVVRAHYALGTACEVIEADIRSAAFGTADAVVILDVLHYIPEDAQRDVLQRVRAALPRGGGLLLRVADADAGVRFRVTRWIDRMVLLFRGHGWAQLYCRGVGRWCELLRECGFESRPEPMSQGTPFANVLLVARAV